MGYRMSIKCDDYDFESGTKFYGYVEDLDNLKSIKWLIDNHKLEDDDPDVFNWSPVGPTITLDCYEFREFIKLYEEDVRNVKDSEFLLANHNLEFIDIYCNNKPKTLYWS